MKSKDLLFRKNPAMKLAYLIFKNLFRFMFHQQSITRKANRMILEGHLYNGNKRVTLFILEK